MRVLMLGRFLGERWGSGAVIDKCTVLTTIGRLGGFGHANVFLYLADVYGKSVHCPVSGSRSKRADVYKCMEDKRVRCREPVVSK